MVFALGTAIIAILSITGTATAATFITQAMCANGCTVPAGQTWSFDPNSDTTITSTGNIIVYGTLEMRPANGTIDHFLQFTGINENFQGGGNDPIASDVGLWVMGAGRLDIRGTEKQAWSYDYDPAWAGDEVRAAPNTANSYSNFPLVTSTPAPNALGYKTELMNLTRNVRIEGTSGGYSHVFIRSTSHQTIKYAQFRYVGPNPGAFSGTDSTGRYGIHFHHSGDGSRGTIVEGVVVRNAGNHAFVPHASHGIIFLDTIAYDVASEAYWWDDPPDNNEGSSINDTFDLLYDRAIAAKVESAPGGNNHHLGAFRLGRGDNVTITGSVAVGMQQESGADRSGYIWPEDAEGTWNFSNNIAHNNEANGIFVWQNNELPHLVQGFTAYYNRQASVNHGAYTNSYVYRDLVLLDSPAIISHALGERGDDGTDTQIWANIRTDGGTLLIEEHARDPERPVRFIACDFGRVDVNDRGGAERSEYDFIRCGLEPSDFDLSGARSDSIFRVQRENGTAYELLGDGTVTVIGSFETFSDISGPFEADILWLVEQEITVGCNPPANDKFCPYDSVTRAQMATFLVNALHLPSVGGNRFSDVSGTHLANINAIAEAGVTAGCNPSGTLYCPDDPVSRQQMASFLVNAIDELVPIPGHRFSDVSGVHEMAINGLADAGITVGCNTSGTKFCPRAFVTRAQIAAFLHRALT